MTKKLKLILSFIIKHLLKFIKLIFFSLPVGNLCCLGSHLKCVLFGDKRNRGDSKTNQHGCLILFVNLKYTKLI